MSPGRFHETDTWAPANLSYGSVTMRKYIRDYFD